MSDTQLDVEYSTDDIAAVLGAEEAQVFLKIMGRVDMIMEHPENLVGNKAVVVATELAAYRTKIGLWSQMYKTAQKSITVTKRKNVLMSLYASLEENINTLKLLGRIEAKQMSGGIL